MTFRESVYPFKEIVLSVNDLDMGHLFCHLQTLTSSLVPVTPFPAPLSGCPTIEVE